MKFGFLAIGNEILQGKIQDANGAWLARFLAPLGTTLALQVTAGDSPEEIQSALHYLYQHCDFVICSGGLGPTPDDLTKASLGSFFGSAAPAFSPEARAIAEVHYQRFGRVMPDGHGYGFLPPGFTALDNPSGFAPGLFYQQNERRILAAPGVPKEFRDLLNKHLPPFFQKQGQQLVMLNFRTKGIPEEKIFSELCPGLWDKLARYGSVSSLPHSYSVDVGVTLQGEAAQLTDAIKAVRDLIYHSPLASHVWHEGPESLEEVIVREASLKKLRFGFAESCTGGLCASRITNVSGASQVFWGGVVSYDNSVKTKLLSVKAETLQQNGAVSQATAEAMALGARQQLGVDLAIALTGIAGPGGGSVEKPVGTVWVGMADESGASARRYEFKGDREALKYRFSQVALFHLLDQIREIGC